MKGRGGLVRGAGPGAGLAGAHQLQQLERDAAAVFALSAAEHRNATGRHRAQLTQLSSFAGGAE